MQSVELSLPGPTITRAVTWDMVRAYLRAEGFAPMVHSEWLATWRRPKDQGRFAFVVNKCYGAP